MLSDYRGDHIGPKKWIKIIRGVLDTAKSYVDSSERTGLSDYKITEYLRDANDLGETAYSYTKIIAGAGPQDLPFPVIQPLQRWYSDAGLKNDILFRSDLVANYEIRSIEEDDVNWIRERAPSLDQAIHDIRWPLQCFTVPAKAFGMLPHFAIVAHEIGHAIYHEIGWNFPDLPKLNQELDRRIMRRVGSSSLSTTFVIFKRRVYLSWLQEIVSDACGHLIAGPAFFYAVCGLLQSLGGGFGIGFSHPSNELRRKLLYGKNTEVAGFSHEFESFFKTNSNIQKDLTEDFNSELLERLPQNDILYASLSAKLQNERGITAEEKAALLVELPVLIETIAPDIYRQAEDYLKNVAPELIYAPSNYRSDLNEHYNALLQAIPPIETGTGITARKPVELASILNVGWAVLLVDLDKISVKDYEPSHVHSAKFEKLHSLLLKGLELSEARRDWASV